MYCNKCSGRVFIDRVYSEKKHVELFCIGCGKRWMLDKTKSRFAAWLWKKEQSHANAAIASLPD
ncbi:hypothetical protein SEA_ANNADREAMY_48 [Streptomyces phage Annadreamy]|uniref:Uncharacterized protein n=3 Tax=Annadreamyvirus TaxID=2843347 RepID=A0A345GT97_9CAUD|nr:hypothetical protein HWB75_gp198 [Streptomyces phage Annadreamy]YP_009839245.1 hypothetical protein HWB76_gp209 [Streptomyces phage Blueeyedbeauty]AXG66169.1 hypothetical protein SEA_ANNADREAMY_48 [Streptomyces phage Annadreamy]AXH49386.1 hypothetical protein SEA_BLUEEYEDBEAUTY_50 [Streptomyces phage Blueeyedbeauty]QGH79381.1 hypothetical protein SEA_LIMPID_48 [Streptomyces phage Limpid]